MIDPLLQIQIERHLQPAFDKIRTDMMAFSQRMADFDLDALLDNDNQNEDNL